MSGLDYARLTTALVLAVHISFAVLGVGLPTLITIAHGIGLRRHDEHWLALAQHWSRLFIVLFLVGALTGTAIGVLLPFLWPGFMEVLGQVNIVPLFAEVFAFFRVGECRAL